MSSPDGCPGYLNDGTYAISTSSLWVGTESVGDVINVVVDKPETAFYFRWLHASPCTYEINLGTQQNSQFVRHDKEWINIFNGQYQQWVLKKVTGDTYNIALQQDQNLVWTDLGPGSPADRQLQLQSFSGSTNQQFRITRY